MKILLAVQPFLGHVLPTLPLVKELAGRGHEVFYFTGESQRALCPYPTTGNFFWHDADFPKTPASLVEWMERFTKRAPAEQAQIQEILDYDIDLFLSDCTVLSAPLVKAKRWAVLSLFPMLFPPAGAPLILQATIPEFEPNDRIKNLRFIGPLLPQPLGPSIKTMGKYFIHCTQGTLATDPNDLINPTILACEELQKKYPLKVALTISSQRHEEIIGSPLTATFTWLDFPTHLPANQLFITNGGYGGVQTALAAGIPIICAGETEDKFAVGERVEFAGNGINLKTQIPTAHVIHEAILAIQEFVEDPKSNDDYLDRAAWLAERCKEFPAPRLAADLLEQL